jgi:hypothetical protein
MNSLFLVYIMSALYKAIEENDYYTTKQLINDGADIRELDIEYMPNSMPLNTLLIDQCLGWSPIHYAVRYNNIEAIQLLIAHGVNINQQTEHDGISPLHIAALWEYHDVIRLLMGAGANINIKTHREGLIPLWFSSQDRRHGYTNALLLRYYSDLV